MAYQELTPEFGKWNKVGDITGQGLVGTPLKAPLTTYERIYVIPLLTISMGKGTGIVTSVPSDSPDDWAALRDFQTKSGIREKYNVKEEWVNGFDPIPIVQIPGFGPMAAVQLVEEFKIQSQKDTAKLKEAKEKVYSKGFYMGNMTIGDCIGKSVQEAKPIVRQMMMDNGQALPYHEPESLVKSRSGDECIVALCDQWFLKYGEEEW